MSNNEGISKYTYRIHPDIQERLDELKTHFKVDEQKEVLNRVVKEFLPQVKTIEKLEEDLKLAKKDRKFVQERISPLLDRLNNLQEYTENIRKDIKLLLKS